MKKFKIIYNRKKCIGAAACAAVCPKYWQMNPDGKADLAGSKENQEGMFELEITEKELNENMEAALACNKDAAQSCPVHVIRIIDEEGKDLI